MAMTTSKAHRPSHMRVAHANADLSFSDCKAPPIAQILTRSFPVKASAATLAIEGEIVVASERLSYCHEKLSLAVHQMCTSTTSLRDRLAHAVLHDFGHLVEGFFPRELRAQFREIHSELTKVPASNRQGLYMATINNMSAKEAKRLIDKIIALREDAAQAYYKRSFSC
jgi:hypothetical protein